MLDVASRSSTTLRGQFRAIYVYFVSDESDGLSFTDDCSLMTLYDCCVMRAVAISYPEVAAIC